MKPMIDPKELRLLNLVNVKDLGYCKVSSLRELNIHAHPINNEYNHHSGGPEDFEPIPLTPEILIACGFTDSPFWIHRKFPHFLTTYDSVYADGYDVYNQCQGTKQGSFVININSLHQLQNLFYCLAGEELNYNPL